MSRATIITEDDLLYLRSILQGLDTLRVTARFSIPEVFEDHRNWLEGFIARVEGESRPPEAGAAP